MYTSHSRFICLVVGSALFVSAHSAYADRYFRTYDTDCMSWYSIYKLAKRSLPDLQALDASISLWNVYGVIRSSAVCVTTEAANEALEEYAESLNEDSQSINRPPEIAGVPNAYGTEGTLYSFTPNSTDPDGDSLNFQIVNRPSWASFSSTTGTLSGSPSYTDAGSYTNIAISVSDGQASASLTAFSITITDINRPPSISGTPDSLVREGNSYSFTPAATDADGDRLTFSISSLPDWASFKTTDGTLIGTPDYDDAGSYNNIIIRVSDGKSTTSLSPFSINVEDNNRPPSISGSPDENATVGEVYSFTPYASDPDGDNLLFSISNTPAWAVFDNTTGTLSGTPEPADIGIYEDIIIKVSDESASTSSITLSIIVNGISDPTGSADLSWQIPTTRTDGTALALSEIGGFRIYMGSTSENLTMIVDLENGATTSYSVTGLAAGSYYFSVTTYDADGNESQYSNIALKDIM